MIRALRSRSLRVWLGIACAGVVGLSGPAMADASASSVQLYTGPTTGGVPTTHTDRSQFKSCADPAPGQPIQTATPEEVGLDSHVLQEAADFHTQKLQETMFVVRFGCLVKTGNLNALFDHTPKHQWSVTKAWSTMVLGRALTLGYLGVEDHVGKYFPNVGDAAHRAITINQLLHHTQGTHMNWTREVQVPGPDRVSEFFSLPIEHQPGTYFQYSQTGPGLLNAIVEKAVGQDFQKFAQEQLFGPLGIKRSDWYWMRDRAGWTEGYSLLHIPALDMLPLSQLMLEGGAYRGTQLIDPQFMRDALVGSASNPAFGYQTWLNSAPFHVTIGLPKRETNDRATVASAPNDMFFTWGWRGRHNFMMPNLGMTVVTTSFDHDFDYGPTDVHTLPAAQGEQEDGYHEFFRILMRSVKDQRVSDPGPWKYGTKTAQSNSDPMQFLEPVQTVDGKASGDPMNNGGVMQNLQDIPGAETGNPPSVPFH